MGRPLAEGIDPIGLRNTLDQPIDPATEETLLDILAALGGSGINTIADGNKSVALAGTAERLIASSTPCRKVIITADIDNTDTVVVGGSTVVASLVGRRGTPLIQGQSVEIEIDDLNKIYVDVVSNGDSVSYTYFNSV